ncbi:MAG: HD domain-containing protein [Candidatus Njordarchaeia archaeon]
MFISSELKFFTGIRDAIHGVILLTRLESDIANLPYMDRLRYIHNSALNYLVYPSLTVTRFTHSLGVMHIAHQFQKVALSRYLRMVKDRDTFVDEFSESYSLLDIEQIVRLAGLLHDVGHGPFSHTIEPVMGEILQKHYPNEVEEMKKLNLDSVHEYYSYKLITGSTSIRDKIIEGNLDPRDVGAILTKDQPKNIGIRLKGLKLLRGIISSQVDADRLDNLLRDSYSVGAPYGFVDIDNIVNNAYILRSKDDLEISFHIRALNSIEHMLDSRYKMYIWIYLHRNSILYDYIITDAVWKMLKDNFLEYKHFHYSNFADEYGDYVDENFILNTLRRAIKGDKIRYWLATSIFNQNRLPIPLWRNYEDLLSLLEDVSTSCDAITLAQKIYQQYNIDRENFLKQLEEFYEDKCNLDVSIIISIKEVPPAYRWWGESIKILSSPKKFVDIQDISLYVKKLYEMGTQYLSFYAYFYVEGKERKHYAKNIGRIRNLFKDFIKERLAEINC